MACSVVHVRSPRSPIDAFALTAELCFAEWDPGVERATQVHGDGPGPDTAFDVRAKGIAGSLALGYEVTHYEAPTEVVARARSRSLTSLGAISVRDVDSGSLVTYDAELTLNGLLHRIGEQAAAGLIRALDGERVADAKP